MVSTRNHPSAFPPPTASPTKASTRDAPSTPSPSQAVFKRDSSSSNDNNYNDNSASSSVRQSTAPRASASSWSHTPSNLTLVWLFVSLPLVIWDTGYVFLRPHSMPGGALQWPLWTPYELYGTVDYVYGWPAWHSGDGFTAAQASLNVVETAGYAVYLWIVYARGRREPQVDGTGAPGRERVGWLGESRTVRGRPAAWAVLIAYGMALMTLSKTVLYWLNEAFSGFQNIGHNDAYSLVVLWVIPNGAWIVLPTYMCYVYGKEILDALDTATGDKKKNQ